MLPVIEYFDFNGAWSHAKKYFEEVISISNLHIPFSVGTIAKIASLHVEFKPRPQPEEAALNIIVFNCNSHDDYMQSIFPRIVSWRAELNVRRNQSETPDRCPDKIVAAREWLVVLVSDDPCSKVTEALRGDFLHSTCVGLSHPIEWVDKVKTLLEKSFASKLRLYDDELAAEPPCSIEQQFCLRDLKACLCEKITLFGDSLRLYCELECSIAAYAKLSEPKSLSLGPIIDYNPQHIRESMSNRTASLEELERYIFARKMSLLCAVGRPIEYLKVGLRSVSSTLEQNPVATFWAIGALKDLLFFFRKECSIIESGGLPYGTDIGDVFEAAIQAGEILRTLLGMVVDVASGVDILKESRAWVFRRLERAPDDLVCLCKLGSFKLNEGRRVERDMFQDTHFDSENWLPQSLSSPEEFELTYCRILQLSAGYSAIAGRHRISQRFQRLLIDVAWERSDYVRILNVTSKSKFPLRWAALNYISYFVALSHRQLGDFESYFKASMALIDTQTQLQFGGRNCLTELITDVSDILHAGTFSASLDLVYNIKEAIHLQSLPSRKPIITSHGQTVALSFEIKSFIAIDLVIDQRIELKFRSNEAGVDWSCFGSGEWIISASSTTNMNLNICCSQIGSWILADVVFWWGSSRLVVSAVDFEVLHIKRISESAVLNIVCPEIVASDTSTSCFIFISMQRERTHRLQLSLEVDHSSDISIEHSHLQALEIKNYALPDDAPPLTVAELTWIGNSRQACTLFFVVEDLSNLPSTCYIQLSLRFGLMIGDVTVHAHYENFLVSQSCMIRCTKLVAHEVFVKRLIRTSSNDTVVTVSLHKLCAHSELHLESYNLSVPFGYEIFDDPNFKCIENSIETSMELSFRLRSFNDPTNDSAILRFQIKSENRWIASSVNFDTRSIYGRAPFSSFLVSVPFLLREPVRSLTKSLYVDVMGSSFVGMPIEEVVDICVKLWRHDCPVRYHIAGIQPDWMSTSPIAGCLELSQFEGSSTWHGELVCTFIPLRTGRLTLPRIELIEMEHDNCDTTLRKRSVASIVIPRSASSGLIGSMAIGNLDSR